jgi:hypothetical protein
MFTHNPFSELTGLFSPEVMQGYIILMFILVVLGTVLDMLHKKSAKYFFEKSKKWAQEAKRPVSGGEKLGLLIKTILSEVITSSEFCYTPRRISHLLTMYGFIIFVVTTAMIIFGADTSSGTLPLWWHIGALMLVIGGYWFWFFIRVDVSSEGHKWYQVHRDDIFIVSLITMVTFALIWSYLQYRGVAGWDMVFFALFIISSTTLFSTVLWSKFAHMFFKPAAAFEKRIRKADGTRENLPADYDPSDPEVQARFPDIPEYMGKNPPYMGLGIKREPPRHY